MKSVKPEKMQSKKLYKTENPKKRFEERGKIFHFEARHKK